jgi:4-alpha-glucanotransferase
MTDRFNVPGVVSDANWRTRFPYSTQQMRDKAELSAEAVKFRDLAKVTRRA